MNTLYVTVEVECGRCDKTVAVRARLNLESAMMTEPTEIRAQLDISSVPSLKTLLTVPRPEGWNTVTRHTQVWMCEACR